MEILRRTSAKNAHTSPDVDEMDVDQPETRHRVGDLHPGLPSLVNWADLGFNTRNRLKSAGPGLPNCNYLGSTNMVFMARNG